MAASTKDVARFSVRHSDKSKPAGEYTLNQPASVGDGFTSMFLPAMYTIVISSASSAVIGCRVSVVWHDLFALYVASH
jgi:hypothetical protein